MPRDPLKGSHKSPQEIAGALGRSAAARLSGRSAYFRVVPGAVLPSGPSGATQGKLIRDSSSGRTTPATGITLRLCCRVKEERTVLCPFASTRGTSSSDDKILKQAADRVSTKGTHARMGMLVVPHKSHRLLKRPCCAARPLEFTQSEITPHNLPAVAVKKMPRGHKIQRRIGRPEIASVEHTHETLATHKKVRRNEIPVAHDVGPGSRQLTQPRPQATQAGNVEERLAVHETDFHPIVVIGKVAAPPLSIKVATLSVRGPQRSDEVRNVECKCRGRRKAGWCNRNTFYPGLYRPRHRIEFTGLAKPQRSRSRNRRMPREFGHGSRFSAKHIGAFDRRHGAQREPRGDT